MTTLTKQTNDEQGNPEVTEKSFKRLNQIRDEDLNSNAEEIIRRLSSTILMETKNQLDHEDIRISIGKEFKRQERIISEDQEH